MSAAQPGPTPLVSVIIPAYQAAPWIAETLNSVFAQTLRDFEVIVVNDGSPDTSQLEAALQPYRERIVYLLQENQGCGAARNTGIRAARGQFVALLDADDIWEPDFLASQTAVLQADPSLDVLYCDARIFGNVREAGQTVMQLCPSDGPVTFEALVTRRCTVHVCVTVARRESLLREGLFDSNLRRNEDFDMWLRVLKRGGRIAYQRRVLGRYRRHPQSLSADSTAMVQGVLTVLAKTAKDPRLTPAERELIERQAIADRASLSLIQGKQALAAGDTQAAARHLTEANAFFHSSKLGLALFLLRIAPGLLSTLYRVRAAR